MDPMIKAKLVDEGGKLIGAAVRLMLSRPGKEASQPVSEPTENGNTAPTINTPQASPQPARFVPQTVPSASLPTREETNVELKRRLAKELYRAELDLAGGLHIAGKPCDCLDNKHTLGIEAAAEELVSADPSNHVYLDIIQWINENHSKLTVEAIRSRNYAGQYPMMASEFKDFRKRVMGTIALSAPVAPVPSVTEVPQQPITLDEAKKLAASEAEQEIEKQWNLAEKKSHVSRKQPPTK
jgi:hypothetical protein